MQQCKVLYLAGSAPVACPNEHITCQSTSRALGPANFFLYGAAPLTSVFMELLR